MVLVLFVVSCVKEPGYNSYKLDISVDFGGFCPQNQVEGAKVILLNQNKSYHEVSYTDQNGKVCFDRVEPGFYSVTVSHSFDKDGDVVWVNGHKAFQVFGAVSDTIKVNLGKSGPFVIKEFYYSGSLTPKGKPYSGDQYIELVNNTSEIQYADGISVLEHESYGTGVNYWQNIHDTIVVKMIWTIPGSGTQVPVFPGRSIVLARTAINHRDDPNGNSLSPVNLGDADFEFYVEKQPVSDLNSPLVKDMEEDFYVFRGNDLAFHVKGGSAIAIARIPGSNQNERKDYINQHLAFKKSASGSGRDHFAMIANQYIFDAVEVVFDEAHAVFKRFPPDLDVGFVFNRSGSGSGKCIRRKVSAVINGNLVYQDTNNSTEDFLTDVDPQPKIYQ